MPEKTGFRATIYSSGTGGQSQRIVMGKNGYTT